MPDKYSKKKKNEPSKYMKVALRKERERKQKEMAKKQASIKEKSTYARQKNKNTVSLGYLIYIFAIIGGAVVLTIILTDDGQNGNTTTTTTTGPPETYGFDHSVTTIDSEEIHFKDYEGQKVVVFEFMTIDCPACDPMVDNLVTVYNDLGSSELEIFTLDVGGSSINELNQYRTDHSITHKISHEGLSLSSYFSLAYTPTTFILDKNGDQYGDGLVGLQSVEDLKSAIQAAMAVS
ncbi:MAG: redoxin domain-containing protein [Candidatus Lokiarchaeota archaeon]|nr:redoxin domain-containing protein [Candidatus Lokiarchaeota archaeon]